MRSTSFIVATTVVIAATLNFGAEGFPRPQGNNGDPSTVDGFALVDGFAFDGPASGSNPTKVPGLPRGTSPAAPVPTPSPIVTPNPQTPPPVVNPTPAPTTVRPEVAQCALNCQFQVTSEYNPVCGSDGVMYNNAGTLVCTRNCGINVTQLHLGRCSTPNIRG